MSWQGDRSAPSNAVRCTLATSRQTLSADLLRPSARTRSHDGPTLLHNALANLLRPSTRARDHHGPALLHDALADLLRPSARTRNHDRPAPYVAVRSGAAACAGAATWTHRPCTHPAPEATALDRVDSVMRERTRSVHT
jgi:hypothetical protein